jgi:hypothetical protein
MVVKKKGIKPKLFLWFLGIFIIGSIISIFSIKSSLFFSGRTASRFFGKGARQVLEIKNMGSHKDFVDISYHTWEKEPSEKDIVKGTGVNVAFWSEAMQKGVKSCLVPGCKAKKKVWRHGFCGVGGISGKWKKMSDAQEKRIDRLPNVFQA